MFNNKPDRSELIFVWGELRDDQIPDDQMPYLAGMKRIKTWKPNAARFGLYPCIILFCFSTFILLLAKLWVYIPIALGLCGIIYVISIFNSPIYCTLCKKEMDSVRPSGWEEGITFDCCKKCNVYCNVKWHRPGD